MTNNIAINSPIESVVKDGRHFLLYTPHKTSLSSGRIVCWPIHDDIWNEFEELRVGEGERVDAHRLELRVGLEPVGVGGLCRPRRRSIMPYGEFPHVFGTDVDLTRPHQRPVPHKHLVEERLVV